ncbi:MAG: GrpB family protein [Sedimentisphaerales bacterium]|nr:GrpB family protein [Sedimentisphaerales bacterium]
MIGLRRHTVRVVESDPGWTDLAAKACVQVREIGGDLIADVQHVGSTAVAGMVAKPILDLAAAVATLDVMPKLIEKLTALGYIYRGDGEDSGGHLFVWETEPNVRTIHLHIVALDDIQWQNYLRFRDMLRRDSDLRKRYSELKEKLKEDFPDDRKSYTGGKHDFIRGVLNTEAKHEPDLE